MAIFCRPTIAKTDYDAFLRIINADMPYTFDIWAYQQSKLAGEKLASGITVRSIEVYPDEFVAYLTKRGRRASRHELDSFAFYKSGLQSD
jgi:hypothetical protein